MPTLLREQDRKYYLDTLGVQIHYRRKQVRLSAASFLNFDESLNSNEFVAPIRQMLQPFSDEIESADLITASSTTDPSGEQTTSNEANSVDPIAVDSAALSDVAGVDTTLSVTDRPAFKLQCVVWQGILFIDSTPLHYQTDQIRYNEQLLKNICLALGATQFSASFKSEMEWPQYTNKRLRQSSADAAVYVQHKIAMILASTAVQKIVLFGEELMPYFALPTDQFGQLSECFQLPCVTSYSLTELIRLPQLKAETWQSIKRFKL